MAFLCAWTPSYSCWSRPSRDSSARSTTLPESLRRLALFDLDGTLIAGSSERRFLRWLLEQGELRPWPVLRALGVALWRLPRGRTAAFKANKAIYRGQPAAWMEELAERFVGEELRWRLRQPLLDRLEAHRDEGLEIALLSGTPEFLLGPLARALGVEIAIGTPMARLLGKLTGSLAGPHPYGAAKAEIVRERFPAEDWDLEASYAYADHASDLEMLALFGHPHLVNPSRRLLARAKGEGLDVDLVD